MAQIDELNAALTAISDELSTVSTDVQGLHDQLVALQNETPPDVDLSGPIATAQSILASLQNVDSITKPEAPVEPEA